MDSINDWVVRAQNGDLESYGQLVRATQVMVYAVALNVLHERTLAEDASQETYLRAFRSLPELSEPSAFVSWLRRIVITVSINMRRRRRTTLLQLDDVPEVPVLDEQEAQWSDHQRHRLSAALLTLTAEERRLCDRRYYGRWSIVRLAESAGVDEPAMRKRLQRVRDKLRKEIEMSEQQGIRPEDIRPEFPAKIVELLARPRLMDLPENPVGKTLDLLRSVYSDFTEQVLPEIVDLEEAHSVAEDALYLDPGELHRLDDRRILRYDLTLPLLLTARYQRKPLRLWAAGKVYRACKSDATHLEAFHQAEVLCVDESVKLDAWHIAGKILQSVNLLLPGSAVRIVPTSYPMCIEAWELEAERDGHWSEIIAWGVFTDKIVRHIGGDPGRITAVGVGYGLERIAMLKYDIDDIRKLEVASVG